MIERGHLEEGGNDVKACMTKQALGIFARETGGHFNSESLVPLEVGNYFWSEHGDSELIFKLSLVASPAPP